MIVNMMALLFAVSLLNFKRIYGVKSLSASQATQMHNSRNLMCQGVASAISRIYFYSGFRKARVQ